MDEIAAELDRRLNDGKKIPQLSAKQNLEFWQASNCHICGKAFKPGDVRVADHNHLTMEFRGASHRDCNLNFREVRVIPVLFHNLTGYDAHLFITKIATLVEGSVQLLAQTKERYISFTKNMKKHKINLRFIDSFKFMASSLEKLASYLTEHEIVNRVFAGESDEKIKLLLRKGVYPYEYTTSLDKLNETHLPPKEAFYSRLNNSAVSDADYEHACKIWREFDIKNLGEYSDLYLKIDVILLSEVFEDFRRLCMQDDGLDPAHYYTTPGLSWDSMLKESEIEFELLTDIDMLLFVERGIRGGVSQCRNRYAKANNPYMIEGYNSQEPDKYLIYFDANNLYGRAMVQPLPYGGFEWVDTNTDWAVSDDSDIGYLLEVD